MSKLAKFARRKNPSRGPRPNPPMGVDLLEYIGPGFGAFAATRLLARFTAAQFARRFPAQAKHAGAVASVGAFLAAWFGAHRVKQLERFHHPIVVGAGIAALQTLVQTYIPKLGAMLAEPAPAAALPARAAAANPVGDLPPGWTDVTSQTRASAWSAFKDSNDGAHEDDEAMPGSMSEYADDIESLLEDDDVGVSEAYS